MEAPARFEVEVKRWREERQDERPPDHLFDLDARPIELLCDDSKYSADADGVIKTELKRLDEYASGMPGMPDTVDLSGSAPSAICPDCWREAQRRVNGPVDA